MDRKKPHTYLGLREEGRKIRLLGISSVEVRGRWCVATKKDKGIYELVLDEPISFKEYRVKFPSGMVAHDPYAFGSSFSEEDATLFSEGRHWKIHEVMGGRLCMRQEVAGVKFSVWAPHAESVSLVGDFNGWDEKQNPMRLLETGGIWELFVPGLQEGEKYKFALFLKRGGVRLKADPYAYQGEMRPSTASIITRIDRHNWHDREWMEKRKRCMHAPLNIYKMHIGSWKTKGGEFLNYRALAPLIVGYVKEMGFTHVELLPVMGHPLDESWGYQVTGFYAISRRYGTVEDFQYFVDFLHQNDVGLIFDWVPGHFPIDDHSIAQFDGSYLYEHEDPKWGYHPKWDTLIFNYGRPEVLNFLIGSALFYLGEMHLDGLRVDAVSSIIYLDFERKPDEWKPNREGGNENLEGIAFLKRLNEKVHDYFPTALMIAEESHAYPGVTDPHHLGFDLRWDLGWSIDTLKFFETDPFYRSHLYESLVHEMSYFYSEKHILPLSHDDVTLGKKSFLSKMPGEEKEKFANLRLLFSYFVCHPGKKLLFMGGEFGQIEEWNCREMLPWELLERPLHQGIYRCLQALNKLYLSNPPLFSEDFSEDGFEWVIKSDQERQVLAYLRKGEGKILFCIHNFSLSLLEEYVVPYVAKEEIFSTDSKEYGGSGIVSQTVEKTETGMRLTLPPLATIVMSG